MANSNYENIRKEVVALKASIDSSREVIIRDEAIKERFRSLYRSWHWVVFPDLKKYITNQRELYKLEAELSQIAQNASKNTKRDNYKKRFKRSQQLLDSLMLRIPPDGSITKVEPVNIRNGLFINEIPDLPMEFVPDQLIGFKEKIKEFVFENGFDKSVFIMIRYRKRNEKVIKAIKEILAENNLRGIVASDWKLTDDLYNPIACLLVCSKGIAVFDAAEKSQVINPNVAYELGMFHLLGRNCLILKHHSLKTLHSDILMKLYEKFDKVDDVKKKVQEWLK